MTFRFRVTWTVFAVFTKTCLCLPRYYISRVWSGVTNVFILLHSINLAVILLAAWIYLHPFDAVRPSMQWIYVAHAIAFISLVLVVVQAFLCPRNLTLWGIRIQGWSIFVLMTAGFMYWVFDGICFPGFGVFTGHHRHGYVRRWPDAGLRFLPGPASSEVSPCLRRRYR